MIFIRSETTIRLLKAASLGDLLVLAAIKAQAGRDGRCRKSLPSIAGNLGLHPRTMRKRVRTLTELGYVRALAVHTLARTEHEVIESHGGAVIEFDPANLHLGDAFAVWLWLKARGGVLTGRLDSIASSVGVSRVTLDLYSVRLKAAGLLRRKRVSRSEFRLEALAVLSEPLVPEQENHLQRLPSPRKELMDVASLVDIARLSLRRVGLST